MVGKGLPVLKNALKQLEGLSKAASVGTAEVIQKAYHQLTKLQAARLVFAYVTLVLLYVIMMLILTSSVIDLVGFSTPHRLPPFVDQAQLKHFNTAQDTLMIVFVALGVNFLLVILVFLIYLLIKLKHIEAPLSGSMSYFAHPVLKYIFGIMSFIFVFIITVFSILRITCADANTLVQDLELLSNTSFADTNFTNAAHAAVSGLLTNCTAPHTDIAKCGYSGVHLLMSLESRTRRLWTGSTSGGLTEAGIPRMLTAVGSCWMTKEVVPVILLVMFILYMFLHLWMVIRALRRRRLGTIIEDEHLPLTSYEDGELDEEGGADNLLYAIPPGSTIPGMRKWNYTPARA
ncbi:ORF59 [Ictalurid herpesvirus 1]|uniref:Putative membrane protein ORF59 n=1 Tax=Ictalurid herpesvirus 1 (strain Auburn) TaxID=766178 RepID=VG59_ICHVA|nr:ORF59 [Ictalurid herpesvirus 1]Q00138.1 RecName: Full=Putative membrane protein ORF59 [Ictalurid herpesvirus 1 (strain Auburn)]AAA88162.1 ORF59 [Ictalurid herpesvirus 1]